MYQTRSCTPDKCLAETRCVSSTSCDIIPITTPIVDTVNLRKITIDGNKVFVNYYKNFADCAHLKTASTNIILHAQNYYCASGEQTISKDRFLFNNQLQSGLKVKLCHGNKGNICSDIMTILDLADSQLADQNGPQSANYNNAVVTIDGGVTITEGPTAGACIRGNLGNLNCSVDGCIDSADFELFRQTFGQEVSGITALAGQYTSDLAVDSANLINTTDYEILRSNFGTCQ